MGSLSDFSVMTRAAKMVDRQLDAVRGAIQHGWILNSVEVDLVEFSEVNLTFNFRKEGVPIGYGIDVTCIVDPDDERLQPEDYEMGGIPNNSGWEDQNADFQD